MRSTTVFWALAPLGLALMVWNTGVHAQAQKPWDPFAAQTYRGPEPKKSSDGGQSPVVERSGAGGAIQQNSDQQNNGQQDAGAVAAPGGPVVGRENNSRPFLRTMDGVSANSKANSGSQDAREENFRAGRNGPLNRGATAGGGAAESGSNIGSTIERSDLAPVVAADGSGLPYELWRGLDLAGVEKLLSRLEIPPRSQALHGLWVRLITSQATISDDPSTDQKFSALRSQGLYRSGLIEGQQGEGSATAELNPLNVIFRARSAIVLGAVEQGCRDVRKIDVNVLPDSLKSETILMAGYCSAIAGNSAATQMATELAREQQISDKAGLAALEALALGTRAELPTKGRVTGLTYRLLEKADQKPGVEIIGRAEPALLVALVNDKSLVPDMRVGAAEAAARINAIKPSRLAEVYRQSAGGAPAASQQTSNWAVQRASAAQTGGSLERAKLLVGLENEYTPFKKARLIRSFLDNARRVGLYLPALQMMHGPSDGLAPVPEISWFSETAIEIALASKDFSRARSWVAMSARQDTRSTGNLDHWLALTDISDPEQQGPRGESLKSVEQMALNGRFGSEQLHRLATVLDALEYHVPIPLWQAASNTPQPSGGHLPETGVLTRLQDAAKNREFGRTVLLAMQALGPNGAEGAHMIALGDSIRALKRAGLEDDARRLGFEALFARWPRVTSR